MALIEFFLKRSSVVNVLLLSILTVGVLIWVKIGKEEMPEFASDWLQITVSYPGSAAQNVELFITKPIEDELKGLSEIEEVVTTSSFGRSSVRVHFGSNLSLDLMREKVQEVKDLVNDVDLPQEADEPRFRQFKSSEKAIIDIGLYLKDKELLDTESRQKLQKLTLDLKNGITNLPELSGVNTRGYLRPEIIIEAAPEKLKKYEVSMSQIERQIKGQNIRRPIGSLTDKGESNVTLTGELEKLSDFSDVIVSSGFDGQSLGLDQVASVRDGFERSTTITKIQGREGIFLSVTKNATTDILTAQKALKKFIETFKQQTANDGLGIILMDDESLEVKNRISLIASNGLIGFGLIVFTLFLFLDLRSGFWVALGIPFSLAVTLILAFGLGYTVNNMTLAAVIIVLGIVVDDAIIVAENIARKQRLGAQKATLNGALEMINPVVASILTTCAAFIPLFFFEGWFGKLVKYIPAIVFLMLFASILESFLILPNHLKKPRSISKKESLAKTRAAVTLYLEQKYASFIKKLLPWRTTVFIMFAGLLASAYFVLDSKLNYVLFPREESKDFRVKVVAPEGTDRITTANMIKRVEDVFVTSPYVVGVRASVAQSRRGGQVKENEANLTVEVVPPEKRPVSLNQLFEKWNKTFESFEEFEQIRLLKSRWGSSSGSAIEIEIQENSDVKREKLANSLKDELSKLGFLANVEIERPLVKNEYSLEVKKAEVNNLDVDFAVLSSTLRAFVEGNILYTITSGEEEVDVRFTALGQTKNNIEDILDLTVANRQNYLIPIRNLVEVTKTSKPSNIQRKNFRRTTDVFADISPGSTITPLEIADVIESSIFPKLLSESLSSNIVFRGEIEDSRESQGNFAVSIVLAVGLIYLILVFLFNSIWTPLLIASIIPFGVVGVVYAFWAHGMTQFGFFSIIGTLGMLGVVVNGAIVLISKLERDLVKFSGSKDMLFKSIAKTSSTRLRAVVLTTVTTLMGLFPTAYGFAGYDAMLSEMMLAMCWGLVFGVFITLVLTPCLYSVLAQVKFRSEIRTQST